MAYGGRPAATLPVGFSGAAVRALACAGVLSPDHHRPDVMGGAPCVRQSRIPVATLLAMMAEGMSVTDILTDLPFLDEDDLAEVSNFAADAVRDRAARPA
ncbi:DUF433 domain-containing protein [Micromonospora sp. NPDC050686]|uniref:DUF433 domain-containing protein n=1 Tax=Micromonospora sp. NPDC050686 TaxID=3154631 RepID=UPI0033F1178A